MCQSGTSIPGRPGATPGATAPAGGSTVACGSHASAILLIDELGRPMARAAVRVTIGGTAADMRADASGMICFSVSPGTGVQLELVEAHEAGPGESTTTSSGKHFRTSGTGP